MTPERWRQIEELYQTGRERSGAERAAFLEEACQGDEELRREVESLLAQQEQAHSFLESPALDVAAAELAGENSPSLVGKHLVGKQIGSYRVLSLLGKGGMGEVYLAQDEKLDRKVALKFLPPELQQDETARHRFLREAKSAAALDHPFICHIHEIGETDGEAFFAMEYVPGERLDQRLAKGPLPLKEALERAVEISEALEAAHKQHIVHRDLKPSNILLTPEGHAKVMDFGLAKRLPSEDGDRKLPTATLSQTGITLGTLPYMSPEQLRGEAVDARSDLFSFGVVLYEMLTGVHPFLKQQAVETGNAILNQTPASLSEEVSDVPPLLQHIVSKLLAKAPERRYQHIGDVRLDLEELREDARKRLHDIADARIEIEEAISAPPAAESISTRRPARTWALGALLAGLVLGLAAAFILWPSSPTPSLPVVRSRINIGAGLWLDGMRSYPEWPTRTAVEVASDGSFVVYSAIPENPGPEAKPQIYLRRMDQIAATRVPGTEGGINPFLSPDDQWLGFWEGPGSLAERFGSPMQAGRLKKVSLKGGVPTPLCDVTWPFGADWGPDNRIVFAPQENQGLFMVPADGGKPKVLTAPDRGKGEYGHRLPRYLPDGMNVLFTIMSGIEDLEPRLALLDLRTGKGRVLIKNAADAHYLRTGHLVFLRQGTLMAVRFDLDRLEVRGQPAPVLAGVMQALNSGNSAFSTAAGQYSLSGQGWLAYVPGGIFAHTDNSLVRLGEKGKMQPISNLEAPLVAPRFSPDGQRIAYWTIGIESHVWVYDLARDSATRLTSEGHAKFPVWTPDGKRLVYGWGDARDASVNLHWQPADASGFMEKLATSENNQSPGSFTPDGSVLAFAEQNRETRSDIHVLDMNSRETRPFLHSPAEEWWPEFSPDGRWLAYGSDESGRCEVWVRPFPGPGGRWQISKSGGQEPIWSRDGKQLFYRQPPEVWVVDVQTESGFSAGKPRLLFEHRGFVFAWPVRSWDIWPDRPEFLIVQGEERKPRPVSEIILVQNWLEELKRLVP